MNAEFYETELSIDDALMDLFIDQLHQFAEMELEEDLAAPLWVSSSVG
jgi:phage gp29-like protein